MAHAARTGLIVWFCLSLWMAAWSAECRPARRAVVLLTDCGTDMDDQWAIAHLALSPEIDLRGIVTSHAFGMPKPEAEFSAKAARDVLAQMPLTRTPPVLPGSSDALADKTRPLSNSGVAFLLKQSRGFSPAHRLSVLVIGAATDAASALLTDPTLADRIEIIAMGFNGWPEGGDEWNIKNDPKAWQVLLESHVPIVVGAQEVCKRDLAMTREHATQLFGKRGASGQYLAHLLTDWLDKHPDFTQGGSWPVWDEVTVGYLLGLAKSVAHPRPTLSDAMQFQQSSSADLSGRILWITDVDSNRLWDDFTGKLDRARSNDRPQSAQ